MNDLQQLAEIPNFKAFLRVIREGETNQTDDAYRMVNGGGLFNAPPWEHPYKGLSTNEGGKAAGAPQFIPHTWDGLARKYGFADFSPENQDLGAIALIIEHGALDDVSEGRLDEAIRKLSKVWVSLPGLGARATKIFGRYGGVLAQVSADRGGDTAAPVSEQPQERKPMFLAALIQAALSVAPDLIRLIGGDTPNANRNAAVAQDIGRVAMQVTGAVNEQDAAEKLQDEANAEKFREAVRENFDRWMGMTVKFGEMDEASRVKAREFAVARGRQPVLFRFDFIELLSLIFVLISAAGGGFVLQGDFPPELKGAVITIGLIGGYMGVKEYWFGSSMGSRAKDERNSTGAK